MRRLIYLAFSFVAILALAGGGASFWVYAGFTKPGPLSRDVVVVVEPGSGVGKIAADLARRDVISDPFIFRLGARFLSDRKPLKAGEFLFPARISSREAIQLLQVGKTVVRRVTFAEGLTSQEIVRQLLMTQGLTGTIENVPAEGALLPETYHFSFGDVRTDVLERMATDMDKLVQQLWDVRDAGLPLKTAEEAVILASIVEKETGLASERKRVAGVFMNRLRKGVRLQTDPTVVYGLTKGKGPLGRSLTRSDLKSDTPFNTYLIKGLPPTPIANPGYKSLEAVMHPMETDDFYFVADGRGGHLFARTLAEHNRNVARWRKIERARKKSGQQTPSQ